MLSTGAFNLFSNRFARTVSMEELRDKASNDTVYYPLNTLAPKRARDAEWFICKESKILK